MTIYENYFDTAQNTPLVNISQVLNGNMRVYAKLEGQNPSGSVKDRAAQVMLEKLLQEKTINKETTIIESSSGNFGVSLANYCKKHGLKFICVVDPKILSINEFLMKAAGATVVNVTEADSSGGYLLSRINEVKQLLGTIKNSYWINQYENYDNAHAYGMTVGKEILVDIVPDLVFLGVSSGGTISGISSYIKQINPDVRIIAVDIEGSIIFGGKPGNRLIPGIGASIVPKVLSKAEIDDVIYVNEKDSIKMCKRILTETGIFAGGSSGSVLAGVEKYIEESNDEKKSEIAVVLFADRGERYFETIYNETWIEKI